MIHILFVRSPFHLTFFTLRYAQSVGAKHYDTSAKLDKGVSDMMLDLTKSEFLELEFLSVPLCFGLLSEFRLRM